MIIHGTVSVAAGAAGLFGTLMEGLEDFASSILPDDFCFNCFVEGFLEGAAFGFLTVAALTLIATVSAPLAIVLGVVLAALGVVALVSLIFNWHSMSGREKSHALGNLLGGLVGGKLGSEIPVAPISGIRWLAAPDGTMVPVLATVGDIAPVASEEGSLGKTLLMTGEGEGGGTPKVRSRYADGTPVYQGQQPPRLPGGSQPEPSPGAGPHSRLRWDEVNNRVYQAREFDANGNPIRDIDFTSPTYPNGNVRPDHLPPPHQHLFEINDPKVGPKSGWIRVKTPSPLED